MVQSPVKSVRIVSQKQNISKSSVNRILMTHKFLPYTARLVQDRRLKFCEWMRAHMDSSIFFSDEAIFHLNGKVNRHSLRYWSDNDPRWNEEGHYQNNPRIMVWDGMWETKIIDPYFFIDNVTLESYLELLQTLFGYLEDTPISQRLSFFSAGWSYTNLANCVRNYLNQTFLNRWI